MKKAIRILAFLLALLLVFGAAGCQKKDKSAAKKGSESQKTEENGFYDNDGNFYEYFDEDGDENWDGFQDKDGKKFFYFDEDGDGTIDGYSDEEGNRSYYKDGSAIEADAKNEGESGSGTDKKDGKTNTDSTPVVTKSSEELYKGIKGTTVSVLFASEPTALEKKRVKAFEIAYNCSVSPKVIAWNDFKNQFLAMVSAGNVPDACNVPDETFLKWVTKGLLQPLDSYVNPTDELWSDTAWNAFSWKQKHYGVSGTDGTGLYCIYNATLFKNKGVKTPLEYYNAGQWNFANFKKTCIAMTYGDVTGCSVSWRYLLHLCNGSTVVNINRDKGTVKSGLADKAAVTATELLVSLRQKNYVTFEAPFEPFGNSKIAMVLERPWNIIGQYDLRNTTLKNSEIEICPLPKGPDAAKEYCVSIMNAGCVPSKAKNPLGGCAWHYFGVKYSKAHKNDADVIEDRRKTYTDKQYAFVEDYEKKHPHINTFVYGIGNWYSEDWGYWANMILDGASVQAANAKFAGEFQAMIDSLGSN